MGENKQKKTKKMVASFAAILGFWELKALAWDGTHGVLVCFDAIYPMV